MLANLRRDFKLITIGVKANDGLCLKRFRFRDAAIHIKVSDDELQQINRQVRERNFIPDVEIVNENKSGEMLQADLLAIIQRTNPREIRKH
jgi:hypothetical protein